MRTSPLALTSLRDDLLAWYDQASRPLPWRLSADAYGVWVSEIMLQQTQVATVIPYWERWMARFPTVQSLAQADEQEALALWQGLGYYRRCRQLLAGARLVALEGMPTNRDGWLEVPGVGPYTAGAIASIALGQEAALVDGNVERVYARLMDDASTGNEFRKAVWKWAELHVQGPRPGDWNQALMELGATVCRPILPDCAACPVRAHCRGHLAGTQQVLPTKTPKRAQVERHHLTWVVAHFGEGETRWGIRQIPEGQWSESLWEFPRIDLNTSGEDDLIALTGECWPEAAGSFRHVVTHHRIRMDVALCRVEHMAPSLRWLTAAELAATPMPAPQRRAWKLACLLLSGDRT